MAKVPLALIGRSRDSFVALRIHSLIVACFAFGSCSETPSLKNCRLVGTWEQELTMGTSLAKLLREQGKDPDQSMKETLAQMRAHGELPPRQSFEDDGTFVLEGQIFEHKTRDTYRWSLVQDVGDSVKITLDDPSKHSSEPVTYVFETPDLIRAEDGLMQGTKYQRVR